MFVVEGFCALISGCLLGRPRSGAFARMRGGLWPVDENGICGGSFSCPFVANSLKYYARLATGELTILIDDTGQCCALTICFGVH